MKKKIIVDLDVVTIAKWDKGKQAENARKFIAKVQQREYYVITPTTLIQLVKKWKHNKLVGKIESFYLNYSDEFVERIDIIEDILIKEIDFEKLFNEILGKSIKEENITLILVSSLKNAKLVTFNKVHLKNKEEEINEVLSKFRLGTIQIIFPEEA